MPRQIRHNVEGGWYHITTRGMGRREIFSDDRDRVHFLELLQGLVERYGVILHAYVLMDNHYHLLIETPHANASRAMQWMNVSYAAWYNARHDRTGPLFQQRYRGIPVEGEGSWALSCSVYIHLNPVRVKALGLDKEVRAREKAGFLREEPTREEVRERLAKLRGHRWSSYPAYAGYGYKPEWLTCEVLWKRASGDGKEVQAGTTRVTSRHSIPLKNPQPVAPPRLAAAVFPPQSALRYWTAKRAWSVHEQAVRAIST